MASFKTLTFFSTLVLYLSLFTTLQFTAVEAAAVYHTQRVDTLPSHTPYLPRQGGTFTCTNPSIRVEWRNMSLSDRTAYANAVICLSKSPSILGGSSGHKTSRLDDLTQVHVSLNPKIHLVASFLPWHRYFLYLHEQALQDVCGYTGPTPYWDWTQDADSNTVDKSPIWSANGGFGGNGKFDTKHNQDGPITNGPYVNMTLNIVETSAAGGFGYSPHKLSRNFNDGGNSIGNMMDNYYNSNAIRQVNANTKFGTFAPALEQGPHDAFHDAIGGDMAPSQSPNDPIFYLHHANIDRLWTKWQEANPSARLNDYSGNTVQTSRSNPQGNPAAKLTDILNFKGYAPSVLVQDVMNTRSGVFCYEYDA